MVDRTLRCTTCLMHEQHSIFSNKLASKQRLRITDTLTSEPSRLNLMELPQEEAPKKQSIIKSNRDHLKGRLMVTRNNNAKRQFITTISSSTTSQNTSIISAAGPGRGFAFGAKIGGFMNDTA